MLLLVPSLSLFVVARAISAPASAQLTQYRVWAVMPFVDDKGGKLGQEAADRFQEELGRRAREFTPAITVSSPESVNRTIEALDLKPPVTDETSFLLVGERLHAEVLVRGELMNYRIISGPDGKQAKVILRVEVVNVASGLPINGAALVASSSVRQGVSDESILNEAFTLGASKAVSDVLSQSLPRATILSTYDTTALINEGARSGFKDGQEVIVQRGREQVATGRIRDVEPDQATVEVVNSTKGLTPGDHVTVIFAVPKISAEFGPNDTVKPIGHRSGGNNSALISLLLLVGLGIILLGNGHSSSTSPLAGVIAEPTLYPESGSGVENTAGEAAVKISWRTDLFAGGNSIRLAFQVYRSDYPASAVQVVGSGTVAYDTIEARDAATFEWYDFQHVYSSIGVIQSTLGCTYVSPSAPAAAPPGVTPGRSYSYSVSEVFQLTSLQLPVASTSTGSSGTTSTSTSTASSTAGFSSTSTSTATATGTGGTTATTGLTTTGSSSTATGTTATGTTATGTTATGGTTGANQVCDFETTPKAAIGLATPLAPPTVQSPADQTTITQPTPFSFSSVLNPNFPTQMQYVLQFSTTPSFTKGPNTYTYPSFISGASGLLSTPAEDVSSSSLPSGIRSASIVYWRIGARSVQDNPGPVLDISGQRYIFSPSRQFKRIVNSPPGSP